jgi:2-polyprenyl-6-methoxyphenol hydroxylase-like FAD-dependent oxidoreductase
MSFHVLVAGAGLGGLCLAQGLRKEGIRVSVYERDPRPDTAQGYRIHVNRAGSRALHACLPTLVWEAFVATAGQPCTGLGFMTEQMRELMFVEQWRIERRRAASVPDPSTGEHPVNRALLRHVLLGGLDDVVHFGKELTRFDLTDQGVTAHFVDGTSAHGDLLVAADGVGSRVRQQYLPQAKIVDLGVVGVGGRLSIDSASRKWLPDPFVKRLNNVLPERGSGMFIAQYIRKPERMQLENRISPPGSHFDDLPDHVFWAFIARREKYRAGADPRSLDGAELRNDVLRMIEGWHSDLRRLVSDSDPRAITAIRIQTSEPPPRWSTTRVTLLGDAIHAMTPLQGLGGNTAFRDAQLLCRKLAEVHRGHSELLPAIEAYEQAMLDYAFEAVSRSRRVGDLAVSENGFGRAVFRSFLRVADGVPVLKQRMFGSRGG